MFKNVRSNAIKHGPARAPARAMLRATGLDDAAIAKPLVAVVHTWSDVSPCNITLRDLAQNVREGVIAGGGTPIEFNTIAVTDGIAMGSEGMRSSLASRETIADSIELAVNGHCLDAVVMLVGCDKTIPAAAMAAARLNIPTVILYGGTIMPGHCPRRAAEIAKQLATQPTSPLLVVALVMVLVAFGFKAAAAPFHLWAPDVYQGAPAPSAALIASASKLAGFIFFTRLLWSGLGETAGAGTNFPPAAGWIPVVALIAAASLLIGNFGALAQTNVRRLLAYSAIAHSGAILLGVIAARDAGVGPLFYYAATYGIATVGAFGVIGAIETTSPCQKLTDLAGLYRRSPLLAICLFVFVLSLAGIPPLAGFFGKFAVFAAALKLAGLGSYVGWLALAAILLSAVALYYYLLILKQALVAPPTAEASRIAVPPEAAIALVVAAAMLVFLGVFPSVLLRMVG